MDSLVTTDWLAAQLGAQDLRVLDASMHLADAERDARAEYTAGHIPGAAFMDLARLVDPDSPIENTLPASAQFAAHMTALGVARGMRTVFYDDSDLHSSARAWFMLKLYEVRDIAILDGGLAKWKAEGRPLSAGAAAIEPCAPFAPAAADAALLRNEADLLANLATGVEQVLDARGGPRFAGTAPEPRPGIAPGHIPGAINVPYKMLYEADGTFKDDARLRAAFEEAGVDLSRPVVATCGSGITACALAFALDRIGKTDVALYDGSWAEWGADPTTPKETAAG